VDATEVKKLFSSRGWKSVDVAAYLGLSVQYLSACVNNKRRGNLYDCAFMGLPLRGSVEVVREPRHVRTSRKAHSIRVELYPVGRVLEAENSRVLPEGARVVVVASTFQQVAHGDAPEFTLRILDGDGAGTVFVLAYDAVVRDFHDTGLDF
jgi:hypothetical protein